MPLLSTQTMSHYDCTDRLDSLKQQLFFHHERRRLVETGPKLTSDQRVEQLEYHDRLVMRLPIQLIELEGH